MTSKRFHRLFLPVGLALAILLGLAWPAPGSQVATASLAGLVALVCLRSGLLMKNAEMTFGAKFFKSLALVCLVNLAGGFALALWVAPLFPLKAGAALGLTVILCAPTTLSSAAVIARQSGGNSAWALGLTAVLTVVGTLLMPWMLGLGWAMGADATLGLALGLAGLVLIPLGAGLALRQTLKLPPWGGLLPSGGIILVVWMSSSLHHQELAENSLASIGLWAIAALSLHGALLALAWLASL